MKKFWNVLFQGKKEETIASETAANHKWNYIVQADNEGEAQKTVADMAHQVGISDVVVTNINTNDCTSTYIPYSDSESCTDTTPVPSYSSYASYTDEVWDNGDPIFTEDYDGWVEDDDWIEDLEYIPYASNPQDLIPRSTLRSYEINTTSTNDKKYIPYHQAATTCQSKDKLPRVFQESTPSGYYPYKTFFRVRIPMNTEVALCNTQKTCLEI